MKKRSGEPVRPNLLPRPQPSKRRSLQLRKWPTLNRTERRSCSLMQCLRDYYIPTTLLRLRFESHWLFNDAEQPAREAVAMCSWLSS